MVFDSNLLLHRRLIVGEGLIGPESVVFDSHIESVITGLRNGTIYKLNVDGRDDGHTLIADVGGCPLGMVYGNDRTLYVADPSKGMSSSSCCCYCCRRRRLVVVVVIVLVVVLVLTADSAVSLFIVIKGSWLSGSRPGPTAFP